MNNILHQFVTGLTRGKAINKTVQHIMQLMSFYISRQWTLSLACIWLAANQEGNTSSICLGSGEFLLNFLQVITMNLFLTSLTKTLHTL